MNKFFEYVQRLLAPSEFKLYNFNNDKRPTVQDYMENRFKDQLKWYEKQAKSSMNKFYSCQAVIIFFGALIPIINVLPTGEPNMIKVLSATFGGMIIVATGVLQLTKAYENWINYRSTAEQLKQEYHLFELKAEDYSDEKTPSKDSKERLFVEKVESLIRLEGKKYLSTHQYFQPKTTEP
jgi:ABC-type transport system involved in Fe-S cluster assembly fused permease/ATPase subunit